MKTLSLIDFDNRLSKLIDFFHEYGYKIAVYGELEFYTTEDFNIDNIDDLKNLFINFSYNIRDIYPEDGMHQFEIVSEITTDIHDFIYFFSSIRQYLNTLGFITEAKPFLNKPSNAFQINITLVNQNSGTPIFKERSLLAHNIINSICLNSQHCFLFYAPNIASYKRFQYYDINTPVTFSWGTDNRTVAVKLKRNIGFLEFRLCGADAIINSAIYSLLYFTKLAFNTTFPTLEQNFCFNDPFNKKFPRVPFSYTEALKKSNLDFLKII